MFARRLWAVVAAIGLLGCAAPGPDTNPPHADPIRQLSQLLPADAILLGEQHDAPDHQRIHRAVVEALATRSAMAALVLEMAEQGHATERLSPDASEAAVRAALQWNNAAWPWRAYGPAVMVAVRAGVPVLGANLPIARLQEAMRNAALDRLLSGPALKAQQQHIRLGHCGLLPENQISPMTRIQIARDLAMAQTITGAARPGKTVLLLAGRGHVERNLGVPQHLPRELNAKTVLLHAGEASNAINTKAEFDQRWLAQPAPVVDYCANFAARRGTPTLAPPPETTP